MSDLTTRGFDENEASPGSHEPIPMTGDVYTPIDPLAQDDAETDNNSAAGPTDNMSQGGSQSGSGNAAQNTPGHHAADRAIEYDDRAAPAGR